MILAACDDDDASVTADAGYFSDAPVACPPLAIGERDLAFNAFGQLTGVSFVIEGRSDRLRVELYDSTTGGLPPLATGSFELSVPPDDNLATCQHCVWLPVDWDEVEPLTRVFLASSGTMDLTQVGDPLPYEFAGAISGIVLHEATVDETGASSFVSGGDCFTLTYANFDTSATPGQDCLSAEDCGNPLLEVCSPADHRCGPFECGEFAGCQGENQACVGQYRELFEGACYTMCNPGPASGCGAGEACFQLDVAGDFGVCKSLGEGATGDSCERHDVSTSCVAGDVCSSESQTCTHTCEFFAASPACQDGAVCSVLGVCEPPSSGVEAELGEVCDSLELADGCASDGEAFRGICFAYRPEDPLICEKACLGALGCQPDEFCALRFSSGLGICRPIPVCGDGEVGEINEVCDDGDQEDNDGCSADCQTVEYEPICAGLDDLAAGDLSGDTRDGWDGFFASCQFGTARAELFDFVPPGPGRLSLKVDSPTIQTVSVRSSCTGGDLGCTDSSAFGGASTLVLQLTSGAPVVVMVSGATVIDEGPFTLHTEFVAEDCGDGIVAGNEVCDDGDEQGGDGCSADCLTIEYAVLCEDAPLLVDSLSGDTTGAPHLYTGSCTNENRGSGPDRMHRYIAPASGHVFFRLQQGDQDLALAVYSACGEPTAITELDCSSVYDVEEVEADVTAGQELLLVVDGFDPEDAGPYMLSAELR